MAEITEALEGRMAEARGRARQNKQVPFLIRDDGVLYPNVPLLAKKQRFRPYHGDPNASLEERQKYLSGFGQQKRQVIIPDNFVEPEPFDIGKASRDELAAFAMSEYGVALDPSQHLGSLRAKVARLAKGERVESDQVATAGNEED